MRRFLNRLREMPPLVRWGGFAALALLLAFAVWFFFLQGATGPGGIVQTPPLRPALGKTIPFDDYRAAVDEALQHVRDARAASGTDRTTAMQASVAALERVEGAAVTPPLPGALPAEVDNTLLLIELKELSPNLDAVEQSLTALAARLDAAEAGTHIAGTDDGATAIGELNGVLQDAVFDYTRNETPLQRLARWLAGFTGQADPNDVLWRLFLSIVAGAAAGTITYLASQSLGNRWLRFGLSLLVGLIVAGIFYVGVEYLDTTLQVLGAVGLAVAALVVALFLAGLNRASAPSSVRPVSELAAVLGMSSTEARRRAAESATGGDYRSAMRYRCLAVLLAVDEAGMLTFDRAATNREYLFRAPAPIHDDLQPLLVRFDEVWYGGEPTNAEEYAAYDAAATSIESRVASAIRAKAA
jgi:hypothetical protein